MIAIFLCTIIIKAQEIRNITVQEVMTSVLQHHSQLSISEKKIEIAKQNIEVAKLQKLPTITASTSQFYLGNS